MTTNPVAGYMRSEVLIPKQKIVRGLCFVNLRRNSCGGKQLEGLGALQAVQIYDFCLSQSLEMAFSAHFRLNMDELGSIEI